MIQTSRDWVTSLFAIVLFVVAMASTTLGLKQARSASVPGRLLAGAMAPYLVPAGLVGAPAERVVVSQNLPIGNGLGGTVAFNRDGTQFAYAQSREMFTKSPAPIVIRDTQTLTILKSIDVGDFVWSRLGSTTQAPVSFIKWASDGKRILFTNLNYWAILDVASGQVFGIPASVQGIGLPVAWTEPSRIFFGLDNFNGKLRRALDLESMAVTAISEAEWEQATRTASSANFEVSYINYANTRQIAVGRKDASYRRLLNSDHHFFVTVSPDLSRIVHQWEGPMSMYILGTRPAPALRFRVPLTSSKSPSQEERAILAQHLKANVEVSADVFSPETNPFNGRLLGPLRSQAAKGTVRIRSLEGDSMTVDVAFEDQIAAAGDVIANIRTAQDHDSNGYFRGVRPDVWGALELPVAGASGSDNSSALPVPAGVTPNRESAPRDEVGSAESAESLLERAATSEPDGRAFPVRYSVLPGSPDEVWARVNALLGRNKERVASVSRAEGLVVTELRERGFFKVYLKHMIAVTPERQDATRVTIKLLLYWKDYERPGEKLPRPTDAVIEADKFLAELGKR